MGGEDGVDMLRKLKVITKDQLKTYHTEDLEDETNNLSSGSLVEGSGGKERIPWLQQVAFCAADFMMIKM